SYSPTVSRSERDKPRVEARPALVVTKACTKKPVSEDQPSFQRRILPEKCYPCLSTDLSPMSPDHTLRANRSLTTLVNEKATGPPRHDGSKFRFFLCYSYTCRLRKWR